MTDTTLKNRAIIRLSSENSDEDIRAFLQGLVTQDTRKIRPGQPQYGALLSAQGKMMFDFLLWADPENDNVIWIDAEADQATNLAQRLSLYRLRRKITIAADDQLSVHWSIENPDNNMAAADPRLNALGYRWVDTVDNNASADASNAYLAHRLSLGVPEGRSEMGDILWLECNAIELNGVAFDKGCYIGQENTARMNWRQKINRRLVVVPLAASDPQRQRIVYDGLNLAIDHRRTSDLTDMAIAKWQADAIAE